MAFIKRNYEVTSYSFESTSEDDVVVVNYTVLETQEERTLRVGISSLVDFFVKRNFVEKAYITKEGYMVEYEVCMSDCKVIKESLKEFLNHYFLEDYIDEII